MITETVWHYRHMLFGRRYGTVGWVGMPYYVLGEVLAPLFQLLAVLMVPVAIVAGLMAWGEFARIIAIIALAGGLFTAAALFVHGLPPPNLQAMIAAPVIVAIVKRILGE